MKSPLLSTSKQTLKKLKFRQTSQYKNLIKIHSVYSFFTRKQRGMNMANRSKTYYQIRTVNAQEITTLLYRKHNIPLLSTKEFKLIRSVVKQDKRI